MNNNKTTSKQTAGCDVGKIKRLAPAALNDLGRKNEARRQAGLSPVKVMVRCCLFCNGLFESAGFRTCGCGQRGRG